MNSSVTIDDNLRKKIKKLAAELDTTQGDIVFRAIAEFEKKLNIDVKQHNKIARTIIQSAISDQPQLRWRKKIREKLLQPGIDIDELEIRSWGDLSED